MGFLAYYLANWRSIDLMTNYFHNFLSKSIFVLASVVNVCKTGKLPQTIF